MNDFEIKDLKLKYPGTKVTVIDGVNLNIKRGAFHILLGQNGSGKSSLMKCLAGFQNWTGGDISRNGQSRQIDSADFNKDIIFISEDIDLPKFKVSLLAKIYEEVWGKFDYERFAKLLQIAQIPQDRVPHTLSRGQKALTQLALAISAGIKILLIDEITAVLDPYVRKAVVVELVKYHQAGATILVATNIASEFADMNAQVIMLDKGKIYLEGLFSDIVKQFVKVEMPINTTVPKDFIIVGHSTNAVTMLSRSQPINDSNVSAEPITLEEVFIFLSGLRAI